MPNKHFKLENRKQKLLPLSTFFKRLGRYAGFAIVLIAFSAGIGTLGYRVLAGLGWVDAFHMACLILTGMGPVVEMKTTSAKMFDSFYALYSGVAFLSITAVFFAPIIHRLLHILQIDTDDKE